ncbi:class I SAM-dependent methyltransferase [Saccharospirillum mangrovi]|uniref:class I SAM-dependent methyltransferase n=1 Tax=Saccharospirillum mangrovi TaxID=2161747 RepID=UPI000D34DB14|nr:class I SAM-dependent methyltransferase [Saccharospirillum mangrovi]
MPKQQIEAHGLTFLTPEHPSVRAIRDEKGEANIHGTKVWDSSFVLMDYLLLDPIPKRRVVFDIGCGWGPTTYFLKKHFHSKVMSIDADKSVEPYLRLHGELNGFRPVFWQRKLHQLSRDDLSMADTIVGGDICFWDSLRDDWMKLIKRANKAGVRQVLIADPGRQPFYDLADWAKSRFDAELWEHDIRKPIKASRYVLEINLNPD